MSRHHKAAKWTNHNQEIRSIIKAALPLPCRRCGRIILPGEPFDAGHTTDLARGGDATDLTHIAPEHPRCNRQAGGRAGGKAAQAKRRRDRTLPPPGW